MLNVSWVNAPSTIYSRWLNGYATGSTISPPCPDRRYWRYKYAISVTRGTSARALRSSSVNTLTDAQGRCRFQYVAAIPYSVTVTRTVELGPIVDQATMQGPANPAADVNYASLPEGYSEPNYPTWGGVPSLYTNYNLADESTYSLNQFVPIAVVYDPLVEHPYAHFSTGAFTCHFQRWSGGAITHGVRITSAVSLLARYVSSTLSVAGTYNFGGIVEGEAWYAVSGVFAWRPRTLSIILTRDTPTSWTLTVVGANANETFGPYTITADHTGFNVDVAAPPNIPTATAALVAPAALSTKGARYVIADPTSSFSGAAAPPLNLGTSRRFLAFDAIACGDEAGISADSAWKIFAMGVNTAVTKTPSYSSDWMRAIGATATFTFNNGALRITGGSATLTNETCQLASGFGNSAVPIEVFDGSNWVDGGMAGIGVSGGFGTWSYIITSSGGSISVFPVTGSATGFSDASASLTCGAPVGLASGTFLQNNGYTIGPPYGASQGVDVLWTNVPATVSLTWENSPQYCAKVVWSDSRGTVYSKVNIETDNSNAQSFRIIIPGTTTAADRTDLVTRNPLGAYTPAATVPFLTSVEVLAGPCP